MHFASRYTTELRTTHELWVLPVGMFKYAYCAEAPGVCEARGLLSGFVIAWRQIV